MNALRVAIALAALSTLAAAQEFPDGQITPKSDILAELFQPESFAEPLPNPQPAEVKQPEDGSAPSPADDPRLTLAEAESLAVAFHPALREASGNVRAAEGNWLQVGLPPNPNIAYSGDEIGNDGAAGQQGGYISQQFITAGKLGWNRAVAQRGVAASQQQLEAARLQVLTSVRLQYFELVAAERAMVLAQKLGEIASESVRASELRYKAMDIPKTSLLQSQIESESTSLLAQQATERHAAAWRRLAATIGINDPAAIAVEDTFNRPLPLLDWEATRDRVLAASPELAALRFAVEQARLQVQSARAAGVPNVTAQAGAQHDNATGDEIANVQVSVPLPIFDRNQGGIIQASGQLTAAQAELRDRELAIEQRLANGMRDYDVARLRVERYVEKVLPVARESLDIMYAGYEQGELDYLQLLTMQQTYAEKNLAYLQDLETAWKKWAEIEGMMLGPLPDREQ